MLRAHLTEYRVPLLRPVQNARHRWLERRGLLLRLEGPGGATGYGEAAPLPGISEETLENCRAALAQISDQQWLWLDRTPIAELGQGLDGLGSVPPSARFAAETALLDLRARRAELPVHRLLQELLPGLSEPGPLGLVILLDDQLESWPEQTRAALAQGCAGVKAKVGRPEHFDRELAALHRVRTVLGAQGRIRLDANRAFESARITERLDALASVNPEFVEEPGMALEQWPCSPAVPLALDESLRDRPEPTKEWIEQRRLVAVVLKLGQHGGVLEAWPKIAKARALGVSVVVSHLFEGPVGTAAAAELALALGQDRFAHGLAPHAGLLNWSHGLPAAYRQASLAPHAEPGLGLRSSPAPLHSDRR